MYYLLTKIGIKKAIKKAYGNKLDMESSFLRHGNIRTNIMNSPKSGQQVKLWSNPVKYEKNTKKTPCIVQGPR